MRDIERIVSRFREAGLKITPQRLSIFNLLKGNKTHPSAEDVYRQVLKIHPSISFTTVYKTLQTLRDMDEIREINIDPERSHYDPDTREHAHTFCRRCRTIGDLEPETPAVPRIPLPEILPVMEGFEVQDVQIHVVGLCGECR